MRGCMNATFNIAEGAVRAGKTIDNVTMFAYFLERTPDRLHLATGSTMANAKLNIGDANGYGLEHIFRGRCKWIKYKGNDALWVRAAAGPRIVIFAGAGKADSFKKIRGNSYGMWIATEINLHHDDSIKEGMNRQLAATLRKVFWDLNPTSPKSKIYTEYIDKYRAAADQIGGVNYESFSIFDNASIPVGRLEEIKAQYDPGSVWYRRDIEGQRCAAEGLVFEQYANDPARYAIAEAPPDLEFIVIGTDFGGNKSKTVFVAIGITKGFRRLVVLADHSVKGAKGTIDPGRVNAEYIRFLRGVADRFGERIQAGRRVAVPIKYSFADNAEQYLIAGMQAAALRAGVTVPTDCLKIKITDRVFFLSKMLVADRLAVMAGCSCVDESLAGLLWDDDEENDVILDVPGETPNDGFDALSYAVERFIKYFEFKGGKLSG